MALEMDREELLGAALRELERAREGKDKNGENLSLPFREYLVNASHAYIALAREIREAEQYVEQSIRVIRERHEALNEAVE